MVYDGIIQGKTIRLRSVEEADAEITYKMRSDPEKSRFFHAAEGTIENQRKYILSQREKPGDYLFIVEDNFGNAVGMKGLYEYDSVKGIIESGRFVGFGSQIQNIETLLLSFDFAFNYLHVKQINMAALEKNSIMLGIQKKFGSEFTYREQIEGFDCDNLHSVLTKDAYLINRPKIELLIDRFANR